MCSLFSIKTDKFFYMKFNKLFKSIQMNKKAGKPKRVKSFKIKSLCDWKSFFNLKDSFSLLELN